MPNPPLFWIRNRKPLSLKSCYDMLLLTTFSLFFLFGNFFCFLPFSFSSRSLSIAEIAFYSLATPLCLFRFRFSLLLFVFIAASAWYGALLNGFDSTSILYSFKLLCMVASGIVLGEILSKRGGMHFWVVQFSLLMLLGGLMLLLFPRAQALFQMLSERGIYFSGDPHIKRFISPFFDPNFYAAIACIPFLITWHLKKQRPYYSPLAYLFLLSIALTCSRSGIAAASILLLAMGFEFLPKLKTYSPKQLLILLACCLAALTASARELAMFLDRLLHLFDDPSALSRLTNLRLGFSCFLEHPFFGIGYNYLLQNLPTGMDSSLLVTLIAFGLIPTLTVLLGLVVWSVPKLQQKNPLFRWLYIYLWICILFTSQFNNLLYYHYWLIPMIALFTQLGKYENSTRP